MNTIRTGTPTRVIGSGTRLLALGAAVMLMTLTLGAGMAAADSRFHRNAENTFTKWITGPGPAPIVASMAGIVGGDVGDGTFTGEVLTRSTILPRPWGTGRG